MFAKFNKLSRALYERIMGEQITHNVYVFLTNFKYIIFGYSTAALCVFAFEVLAGRNIGAENYGKYVLIGTVSFFLSVVMTFGLTTAGVKYVAQEKEPLERKKIVSTTYLLSLMFITISSIIFFILAPLLSKSFSIVLDIFYVSIIFTICFSLYTLSVDVLRGLNQIKKLSLLRAIYGVSIIFLLLVYILYHSLSFKTVIGIIGAAYILFFLVATHNIKRNLSLSIDQHWAKELLSYGKYAAIGGLLLNFLPRLGQIFINKYLSLADVGIYNAYYLASIGLTVFFCTIFITIFFPTASGYQRKDSITKRLKKALPFFFIIGMPVLFLSQLLILNLYGAQYPVDYLLMCFFSLSGILISIYAIYGWLLYSKNIFGAKVITGLTIGIFFVNIFSNIYLIPRYHLFGAVYSTILTYLIGILCLTTFQKRILKDSE